MNESISDQIKREIEERRIARLSKISEIVRAQSRSLGAPRNELINTLDVYGKRDDSASLTERRYFFDHCVLPELARIGPLNDGFVAKEYEAFCRECDTNLETAATPAGASAQQPTENFSHQPGATSPAQVRSTFSTDAIPPRKSGSMIPNYIIGAVFIGAIAYFAWPKTGFDESQIQEIRTDIKSNYEKRDGVSVEDVVLFRESGNKLKGFVKLRIRGLPDIVTRPCTATTADDEGQYVWQCQ